MIYKYWYYIPASFVSPSSPPFGEIKTDLIDLGSIKLTPKFLLAKIAYESHLLGRVFLRYAPEYQPKDKWLCERIPAGKKSVYKR
jgi:hypothetical protein